MTETLILAAIIAPLVFAPAIILSVHQYVQPLSWPDTELAFLAAEESALARFEREMIDRLCIALSIPKELLEEPYVPVGYSSFRTWMEHMADTAAAYEQSHPLP